MREVSVHRLIWLGATAFLLSPMIAWSHEPSTIIPGSRIRITELGGSKVHSGTVVTADASTVVLSLDTSGKTASFALIGLSRLEVSRGQKGHIAAGVGFGFLLGAGMGALIGAGASGSSEDMPAEYSAAIGAGVGAGIGMLVGGALGATVKSERWEELPSSRWQVSLWPAGPGNLAFALSVAF
jgi:hypothetical protein